MAGLVPAIHAAPRIRAAAEFGMVLNSQNVTAGTLTFVRFFRSAAWMAGTSPAMTAEAFYLNLFVI